MTLDERINDTLAKIHAAAKRGDQVRLRKIIRELIEPLHRDPTMAHQARVAEIGDDPVALADYLGELGMSKRELAYHLGRDPSEDELVSYEHGRALRKLEARALELATARAGGKVPDWMDR